MRRLARLLIIVGMCLGLAVGLSRIGTYLFGESFLEDYQYVAPAMGDADSGAIRSLKSAIARTPANVLKLCGHLVLVIAGGALGLVAAGRPPGEPRRTPALVTMGCGIALAAFGAWLAAIAYILGGVLAMLDRSGHPEEG